MPNKDELLWPGTLVTVQLTLRDEEAVVVPSAAVQVSQAGTFVFVVKDGIATVQPVKVARTVGRHVGLESGLAGRRNRRDRRSTAADRTGRAVALARRKAGA